MHRRLILVVTLALTLVMGLWGAVSAEEWIPIEEFTIGKVLHMTGDVALTGEKQRKGLELVLDETNAAGGINGVPIKVIFEDDLGTNPGAIAALNKLLYDHEVVVTFATVRSTMVHALSPIIEEEEIPAIFGGSAWSLSELRNPWMFRVRCDDRTVGTAMAKFLVENLGHKKIAALHDSDSFGTGGYQETARAMKELFDIEPVTVQKYASGTKDYTAQWMAIRDSGATAVFGWGTRSEDDGIILRQRKEFGLDNLDYVGSASYSSGTTRDIAGDTAFGVHSLADFSWNTTDPYQQEHIEAFKAKYGFLPDTDTTWTSTGMIVFVDAIKRADVLKTENGKHYMRPVKETRRRIRDALRETKDLQTPLGKANCDVWQNLIHSINVIQVVPEGERYISTVTVDFELYQ
ncbi:MAG: ABC transporter substrate-binding protein [Limnochordia bacterium]|jgi:branched-chain amino acid transport system substrate-binding protein